MKINRYISLGIIFIVIAILLFFTDIFSPFIGALTHLFLMGSSKGKDILFFLILGIFLIFSQMFEYNPKFSDNKYIKKIISFKIGFLFKLKNNTYLKISLILIIVTSILGLILELVMRYRMGISPFTIFVAMEPTATTTSIIHSHIYKSVIGGVINSILSGISLRIPLGINTGDSLYLYVPDFANIIIIILPLLFLTLLASLKNRQAPNRLILIFASAIGLIGIFDGGLFSVPCAGGIYGILLIYFDETGFDYYTAKIFKNKPMLKKTKKKMEIIKQYKILSWKTFQRLIPHIFLISIILLGFYVSIIGSNTEHCEIQIINTTNPFNDLNINEAIILNNNNAKNAENKILNNINNSSTLSSINDLNDLNNSLIESLNNYSVISIQKQNFRIIVYISPEYNEMELLNSLIVSLKGKCEAYSMSWDFFSYLKTNNTNLTNSTGFENT
ncbi:hypothetical protein ALNOE001_04710 [Candidatus Methanobinarius endosymbioticus]|uniref:Uncharacterized protein n=1 Tax=Candidatus Methanobinarius endosymbioticus TaxID=2006182 RepID=A0A366MCY7_9EURY|nr:hypothetical protein ALNOE001_04710 [Candidatus Methanobinarius endosymbioticus]